MENEKVTSVFEVNDKKRKIVLRTFTAVIIILLLLAVIILGYYIKSNRLEYYDYSEAGKVDYKVYLKENEFFKEKYLEKDQKYIASLIDTIKANFNYNLQMKENIGSYCYSYDIEAVVDVKDRSDKKTIYTSTKKLAEGRNLSTDEAKTVDINEEIDINYHYYNDLISKFVNAYELNDANSTLLVTMHVKMAKTEEGLNTAENLNVASLEIPLTTRTVSVELITVTPDKTNNKMFLKGNGAKSYLAFTAYTVFIVDIIVLAFAIRYYCLTRTEENVFEGKLNRILHAYKGYIQKADLSKFSYRGYQSVYVDGFNDLLEIRDTLQAPILMLQNKEEREVRFIIPSENKIIYIYLLGTDTVKKRLTAGTADEDTNEDE